MVSSKHGFIFNTDPSLLVMMDEYTMKELNIRVLGI